MNPLLIQIIEGELEHLRAFRDGRNGVNSGLTFYTMITEQFRYFGPDLSRLGLIETWLEDLKGYFSHLYDFTSLGHLEPVLTLPQRRLIVSHLSRYWKTVLTFAATGPECSGDPCCPRGMLDAEGSVRLTEAQIRKRIRDLMTLEYSLQYISTESVYQEAFAG